MGWTLLLVSIKASFCTHCYTYTASCCTHCYTYTASCCTHCYMIVAYTASIRGQGNLDVLF